MATPARRGQAILSPMAPRHRLWAVVLLIAAASSAFGWAQITIPTFGVRGAVPPDILDGFMAALRRAVHETTGLEVSEGDLITAGIAGSLEPTFTTLIAEVDGTRYAVSGEIARAPVGAGQPPYLVNLLVVDVERKRHTDLISETLARDRIADAAGSLARAIATFTGAAIELPAGNAGLFVSSEPGDAEVLLGGIRVGRTSQLDVLMLEPGRYELEVRKEGFLPETRMVVLQGEDTSFVHVNLTATSGGSLQLTSTPPARVFLDDRFEGTTPITLAALPGTHTLRLERDGFRPKTFSVPVRNYRVTRVLDERLEPLTEPLVFWPEEREHLVFIDGLLQPGGYARGLGPGLVVFEVRRGDERWRYTRAIPERGVFSFDPATGELSPLAP